jgi:EAL domain-containing protein (putative c-di-GMP-specific phosphodiesterase class I)
VDEHALLTRLEEAVQVGEFRLFYQPKVHPIYKNVVGAEALIRWFRSDNKIIFPDQFIPVAEQNSIIRPMTWWVLKAAIARAANWKNDVGVAVNIPPNLLLDDELESVIADTLALYDFKPERLTVEVTEGVMVSDQRRMFKTLKRLRENGVRISIDNFGTGYSSMLYFRNLPADEVKLDRTFVMAMIDSKRDATLVKAMIELGHNFGLRVVAEGVENEAIVKALTDLRCDVLQGYHFDKPLPPDDFERRYCK